MLRTVGFKMLSHDNGFWESTCFCSLNKRITDKLSPYFSYCCFFSSSVRGLISSADSEKLEWPDLAAWS